MPVRPLHSSVLRWPSRAEVLETVTAWAQRLSLPGLVAVGVFGFYAPGDAGVGSDPDIVVILEMSELPFERRMGLLPLEGLPVPAEALVYIYTRAEREQRDKRSLRLAETLRREMVWVQGSS